MKYYSEEAINSVKRFMLDFESDKEEAKKYRRQPLIRLEDIEALPAADVAPVKHGYWIDTQLDNFRKVKSKCSECGWSGVSNYDSYVDIFEFEYCPSCGAKMDGGADE